MSDSQRVYLCNQMGCAAPAVYRFTWPGKDEAGICEEHSRKLKSVADAIGCYVQLIPLTEDSV